MTRTWSDHYKLVILEKKGTEAQRHKGVQSNRFSTLFLCPFVPQGIGFSRWLLTNTNAFTYLKINPLQQSEVETLAIPFRPKSLGIKMPYYSSTSFLVSRSGCPLVRTDSLVVIRYAPNKNVFLVSAGEVLVCKSLPQSGNDLLI